MHPWDSTRDATLDGFVENPVRVVGDLSLPNAAGGAEVPFSGPTNGLLLVFFGYTSCPDVCPTTMSDIAKALHRLEPGQAANVRVAMITVDPTRDTAQQMTKYVPYFVEGGLALRTEDRARLDAVVERFGATYELGTPAADGTYEVAHSAFVYGIDDTGHVVVEWPAGMAPAEISHDLQLLLDAASDASDG
jgi:protein SCO1/2